jgi:hypothetical protein
MKVVSLRYLRVCLVYRFNVMTEVSENWSGHESRWCMKHFRPSVNTHLVASCIQLSGIWDCDATYFDFLLVLIMWALNSRNSSYFVSLTWRKRRRSASSLLPPPPSPTNRDIYVRYKKINFALALVRIYSKHYEIVHLHFNIIWIVVSMGFLASYVGHHVINVYTQ